MVGGSRGWGITEFLKDGTHFLLLTSFMRKDYLSPASLWLPN